MIAAGLIPEGSDYGYCPDCEHNYDDDDIEDKKKGHRIRSIDRIIEKIETNTFKDKKFMEVLENWKKKKGAMIRVA